MKKETLNKTILKKNRPLEIFCNQQYKGYHIRGQIGELYDSFSNERTNEYGSAFYRFAITFLMNETYRKVMKDRHKETGPMFCEVYSLSEKEFLAERKRFYLESTGQTEKEHEPNGSALKRILELTPRDTTLVIDLDEANIQESEYLNESIKAKNNVILLSLDFVVNRTQIPPSSEKTVDYLNRIYAIPAFHCFESNEDEDKVIEADFADFFDDIFEITHFTYEYDYMKKREYWTILNSIGELSYEWIQKNAISKRYLKRLNRVNRSIGDRTYPLTSFCWKFFDDLVDDLATQKQIKKCQFCDDFFTYQPRWPTKKFCSPTFEGKNCRKDYDNRLDYRRHPEERKLKAREYQRKKRAEKKEQDRIKAEKKKEENRKYQREYRALLKKYGVKK